MRDRAKLSKIDWRYIIIDEAQRLKERCVPASFSCHSNPSLSSFSYHSRHPLPLELGPLYDYGLLCNCNSSFLICHMSTFLESEWQKELVHWPFPLCSCACGWCVTCAAGLVCLLLVCHAAPIVFVPDCLRLSPAAGALSRQCLCYGSV